MNLWELFLFLYGSEDSSVYLFDSINRQLYDSENLALKAEKTN